MKRGSVLLGMLWAAAIPLVIASAAGAPAPVAPIPDRVILSADQGPPADVVEWKVETGAPGAIRAVLVSTVNAVVPYYEAVRLERVAGTTRTACGQFSDPILLDSGVNRRWVFEMQRASGGACAGRTTGGFVAIGVRAGVETPTSPVP